MKKKGFTLIEMVTAIAVLVIIISFASVIFKASIDSYRTANANTEIMQKLRAITGQLNKDFEGLCKDGYLFIRHDHKDKMEYPYSSTPEQGMWLDRIYYFSTGDFQSWFDPDIKSNISRIFLGHDANSAAESIPETGRAIPLSECVLARDVILLTPGIPSLPDTNNVSFAACKSALSNLEKENPILDLSVSADISDVDNVRRFMCANVGEIKIEWTDGYIDINNTKSIVWLNAYGDGKVGWGPNSSKWPKALKFTFTLYDSKGILKEGRRFTHIVYLD